MAPFESAEGVVCERGERALGTSFLFVPRIARFETINRRDETALASRPFTSNRARAARSGYAFRRCLLTASIR